jgi:hypothetical protein
MNSSCENKKMDNKLIFRVIIFTLMLLVANSRFALAVDELSEDHERKAPSSITGNTTNGEAELLTLNRLRDGGLSLQQIKQQAINIYLEVTRKDVQANDNTEIDYPKSISKKGLAKAQYLPPRMEWLYFYVGTMEPIIRLFTNTVNDTKAGTKRLMIPKAASEPLIPVWKDWSAGIDGLNEQVTAIYKLINEEKPDNIAIGKHAVSMYQIAARLEKTRQKAVAIIRKTDKMGKQSDTIGIR